jgi:hypothetical protein
LGNFLRYPIPWLTATFNTFVLGELLPAAEATKSGTGAVQDKAVPEKKLNNHALNMMDTLCDETDGSISFFDQQMLQFLHEAVANNPFEQLRPQ